MLAASGKTDFGLYGVVGGMVMVALLVNMMSVRDGIAAVMDVRQTYTVEHIQKSLV